MKLQRIDLLDPGDYPVAGLIVAFVAYVLFRLIFGSFSAHLRLIFGSFSGDRP